MNHNNNTNNSPFFPGRKRSFLNALNGVYLVFKTQVNAKIEAVSAMIVVLAGICFKINAIEWVFIVIAIAIVVISEIFNTLIEKLCDKIKPDTDDAIRNIKDIAGGAVLLSVVIAIIIGLIVFIPKIFKGL